MMNLMNFIVAAQPASTSVAPNTTTAGAMGNILSVAMAIAGTLVAIVLIFGITSDAIKHARGVDNKSIAGIIGKVLFLILCIGIIFMAANWQKLGVKAQGFADEGLNLLENNVIKPVKP